MLQAVSLAFAVSYQVFLYAAAGFSVVAAGMLLFMAIFLHRTTGRRNQKARLRQLFGDLIAEISIGENEDELAQVLRTFSENLAQKKWLQKPFARKILIKELVKIKDHISGSSAENLCWLYEALHLDQDTLRQFGEKGWHRKAVAIQHLAEMRQTKHLRKIYHETNHRNRFIRTEAQIAVVKLTGFKGLRFLNIVSYPVTQWQQLSIISQLQAGEVEPEKIKPWLQSKNDSVVQFAIRLVQVYNCYDLHDDIVGCLRHASAAVRLQALQALKEVGTAATPAVLMEGFEHATRPEQWLMLDLLQHSDVGEAELSFFARLQQNGDAALRHRVAEILQQLAPLPPTLPRRTIAGFEGSSQGYFAPQKRAV